MSPEELIRLTESAGQKTTLKLSRRDLSFVGGLRLVGKNYHGGTTIAGTMLLAHLAGIKIFGTGGLGGVHRGAESSMDISADLTELGRTPVTVISSGSKSFLDIPRTLEYLETEGVGVGTFADGREGNVDFPAFWSRDSGIKSPTTIENEIEAAAIIRKCISISRPIFDDSSLKSVQALYVVVSHSSQTRNTRSKYNPASSLQTLAQAKPRSPKKK
jgi:pseudouridine-5'-phosphate glycosidase/pseudouridine kinase